MPRRKRRGGQFKAQPVEAVTLPRMVGDTGPRTAAATRGTVVEVVDEVNNVQRRRRVWPMDEMISRGQLTMAQGQAAHAIRDAFSRVEAISSGGELKEQVDSSPKPDAAIAAQVDARSRWVHVRRPLSLDQREIVEHVCCHGEPLRTLPGRLQVGGGARFRQALDLVAAHLRISR